MKKNYFLFRKIINIFLIVACFLSLVGCNDNNTVDEVNIEISSAANTISEGELVKLTVSVTGGVNQNFTWNISHPDILSIDINSNAFLKSEVNADTAITITVTSDADSTKSDSVILLAKATEKPAVNPPATDVVIGIEGASEIKSGKSINLTSVVTGASDESVTWSIVEGSDYVTIDQNGKFLLSRKPAAFHSGDPLSDHVLRSNGFCAEQDILFLWSK